MREVRGSNVRLGGLRVSQFQASARIGTLQSRASGLQSTTKNTNRAWVRSVPQRCTRTGERLAEYGWKPHRDLFAETNLSPSPFYWYVREHRRGTVLLNSFEVSNATISIVFRQPLNSAGTSLSAASDHRAFSLGDCSFLQCSFWTPGAKHTSSSSAPNQQAPKTLSALIYIYIYICIYVYTHI